MRAVRLIDGDITVCDVEPSVPEYVTDPVTVHVTSCSICGSDLHLRDLGLACTFGHEFGGVLDDGTVGDFAASIVRHASGSNAIGCAGALPDMTFVIRGDVSTVAAVPEPDLLRLAGLAAVAGIAKRRQRRGLVGTAR